MHWTDVFVVFEFGVLAYFAVLSVIYAGGGLLGLRAANRFERQATPRAIRHLRHGGYAKPVSILVPAYNEEATIEASLLSLLALDYPEFEVIVASDGPTDNSLQVMIDAFDLVEEPLLYRALITTMPVRRTFRSQRHPNLVVIDKANGGKADAANAALNLARYPLVCVVDADSLLDGSALLRCTRPFVEDDTVIGAGGTIRPLNGAVVVGGQVVDVRAPKTWVERFQVLEYARAFAIFRMAWSRLNSLLLISGAFGVFRREIVIEVGGWARGYVADDMELVIRLHRHFREQRRPYRLTTIPDPICWTEVPSTFRALRRQRNGWQRGMLEVLWRHRRMLLNPRYGRLGMVGMPYLWIFEAGAAGVEAFGYLYILVTLGLGTLNVPFALAFIALSVFYGVLLSQLAFGLDSRLPGSYDRFSDRMRLLAAAFVEFVGFRQILVFVRAWAVVDVKRRHGKYWTQQRAGIFDAAIGDGTASSAPTRSTASLERSAADEETDYDAPPKTHAGGSTTRVVG